MTNSNLKNSVVMFTFSVFDRKYPFWANLVQKFKIVCLKWNLTPRPSRICQIQRWYSPFYFRREILFLGNFDQKFDRFRPEIHFLENLLPKFKIDCLNWKATFDVTWLISQQFTRRDFNPVAFLVLIKSWKISKPVIIISGIWFPILISLFISPGLQ